MLLFPVVLTDDFPRHELVHYVMPPVGSWNGELAPAASFEGTLSRGIAAEVLAGFPRNGAFGIARADVVTGGALQDFERQELAAVGQGQLAERGLLGHGRAPWKSGASSRSEEHTSELQSLMRISYAVFCLKKKNNHK